MVSIAIIGGRHGAVTLKNTSRVSDAAAKHILSGLESGDIVANGPLERRLLLLSDLPGTRVRSTIAPGTAVGTSDLQVDIDRSRSVTGSIEAGNGGNRYTGYYRAGSSLNLNNPLGIGGGTIVFGASAPPVVVTGPDAQVAIRYNPVSHAMPTDFSARFTLSGGAAVDARMLVFPRAQ